MTTDAFPDSRRSVDGRRVRWNEHRAQRRAAFVEAGAVAIDRWGSSASAEQIADVANVSRTVLYRYFRDREDLRKSIADHVVQAVIASVLPKLDIGPQSTPREVITAAVGVIIAWLDEHPNLYRFLRTRRDGALDSVEVTLADSVAALLKMVMTILGIDDESADPGAYGIVGFVESAGAWWLEHRSMPRERVIAVISNGVWHLLDGTARDHGITLDPDAPLPAGVVVAGTVTTSGAGGVGSVGEAAD